MKTRLSESQVEVFCLQLRFSIFTLSEALTTPTTTRSPVKTSLLISFFVSCRVAQHSDANKMDAHNLAVVFGPTLLRIPSEQDMIAYQSQVNGMIELLIKHCSEVFPGAGESLRAQLSDPEESDSEEGEVEQQLQP